MMWDDFVRLVQLEQLPKQIQFVILSGQICDAKFQCLHISQRYLRSNKCETTLINLIKLSVCSPLCSSPFASYWLRMESISLTLCHNLITFAIQPAPPAVGVFIVDTFPSSALQHEYERHESCRNSCCM